MIETHNLTKMYDAVHGINDITLNIADGTSVGLLGRNGAGKTTFVRTLIGLLKPTSGKALIDGVDVTSNPNGVRGMIGYLPETFGLYNSMTVYELLDYTAKLHRIEKTERTKRIETLLQRFEISNIKDMKAGTLSKGLGQKVGFARALLNDPKVLFLDEPTSGLDPVAARGIENIVTELKAEGKTLLITSHILPEAEKMCGSIALIKEGHLVAYGSLAEIKTRYTQPQILVRLQDPKSVEQAIRLLKPHVTEQIEAQGNQLTMHVNDPEQQTPIINKKLVEADLAVVEIKIDNATLDDVYFKVMEE